MRVCEKDPQTGSVFFKLLSFFATRDDVDGQGQPHHQARAAPEDDENAAGPLSAAVASPPCLPDDAQGRRARHRRERAPARARARAPRARLRRAGRALAGRVPRVDRVRPPRGLRARAPRRGRRRRLPRQRPARARAHAPAPAAALFARLAPFVPRALGARRAAGCNPHIRLYEYAPGQRFGAHYDERARRRRGETEYSVPCT